MLFVALLTEWEFLYVITAILIVFLFAMDVINFMKRYIRYKKEMKKYNKRR